jgi:large subunit ribosomal protein L22
MRTSGSYAPNKTNERPGTRAQARYVRMSATKARAVLDLVRGQPVRRAGEILQYTERAAAEVVGKCLASAVANAVNNDGETAEDLYVSACYADEGPTLKRWRPRARGRATRIRKRTCHVTIVVSPLPEDRLAVLRGREAGTAGRPGRGRSASESRRQRVARSRAAQGVEEEPTETSGTDAPAGARGENPESEVTETTSTSPDVDTMDDTGSAGDAGSAEDAGSDEDVETNAAEQSAADETSDTNATSEDTDEAPAGDADGEGA